MPYENVVVEVDGAVATVTLHRPEQFNAIRPGAELRAALDWRDGPYRQG